MRRLVAWAKVALCVAPVRRLDVDDKRHGPPLWREFRDAATRRTGGRHPPLRAVPGEISRRRIRPIRDIRTSSRRKARLIIPGSWIRTGSPACAPTSECSYPLPRPSPPPLNQDQGSHSTSSAGTIHEDRRMKRTMPRLASACVLYPKSPTCDTSLRAQPGGARGREGGPSLSAAVRACHRQSRYGRGRGSLGCAAALERRIGADECGQSPAVDDPSRRRWRE